MSTNDVPGAVAHHQDKLSIGCWAEHKDGSLILVEGLEGYDVIYVMFDVSKDPITQYRDRMPKDGFETQFSYSKSSKEKWVWHDKTSFPWDRVIKHGLQDGVGFASAVDQLSAAERVADSLKLRKEEIDSKKYKNKTSQRIVSLKQKIADALGSMGK